MVKVFLDSADLKQMVLFKDQVQGFTTNPTLAKKAGVTDYKEWCKRVAEMFPTKPVSLEVIADDLKEMERQARLLAFKGPNVYVKIPITNSIGESCIPLISKLSDERIKINVTAVMTTDQIKSIVPAKPAIISVFAGRIEDTGRSVPQIIPFEGEYLWASSRAARDIYEAGKRGFDIITLTPDLLGKINLQGKDLTQFSLETVQMFHDDAQKAGFVL